MPESTPRVGRWTSETTWACPRPCLSPNHVDRASCDVCHAVRPPLPETPAPSASEIPNDSSEDAIERIARNYVSDINFTRSVGVVDALLSYEDRKALVRAGMALTDAQVVGKEPIAGVDDAGRVKDAIVPLSLDERMALEDSQCFENCGACVNACGDAPDGMPFRVAVARRDIWHALRFASTAQAIAQLDEVAGRMGISPCGDAETVAAFHLRVTDAIVATLRAVPVEGDEPVCYQLRQRGQSGHWLRWESYDSESMRDGFLPRDAEYELRTLYAHPAPDGDIRTVLLHFIDTAGNKRDLVTPDQTCALLDLLNELHPEAPTDGK